MGQARVPVFFAVSRYLRYKYFDVGWGYCPLGDSPQTNLLNDFIYSDSVFNISSKYFGDEYFNIVWGCRPLGTIWEYPLGSPQNGSN